MENNVRYQVFKPHRYIQRFVVIDTATGEEVEAYDDFSNSKPKSLAEEKAKEMNKK